jgi:RNA polymerase sigma-70 factor (ECF subfamily)
LKVLSVAELVPASESWSASAAAFVDRLKQLDDAAWQEFFNLHFRKMYNFAFVRTGDPELAEDVASDVFAAAVKGIGAFRYTGAPLNAWLYRIARSLTADQLKRRRKKPTVPIDDVELAGDNWSPVLDDKRDLARAISKLKPAHQEVLVLIFQEGMSTAEVAQVMHKKAGAVRVLQHRALIALRREMIPGAERQR